MSAATGLGKKLERWEVSRRRRGLGLTPGVWLNLGAGLERVGRGLIWKGALSK